MQKILLIFLILITSIFSGTPEIISGKVVGVIDGDTIKVITLQKDLFKIRLAEIDAPEKKQAYGKKAKWYLSDLIYGKFVTVRITTKDHYGRYIGTVYLGNENINFKMVQNGYAWVYKRYMKTSSLIGWENVARANKLGLWKDNYAIAPWEFRKNKRKKQ